MSDAALAPLSVHEPKDAPRGAILVVQEAFGVNPHIENVCARFAAAGYLAVAPHFFHRSGDPQFGYTDFSQVMPHMQALNSEGVLADVDAGLAHIAAAGIDVPSTGVVGYCMGGTVALVTAVHRKVGAAVTYYGGGVTQGRFGFKPLVEEAPHLQAPWLGVFGDKDLGIPVDDVEALRVAAATAPVPTEIVRYPEAEHGFNCDDRASFHEASSRDAWARTLDWFAKYLVPPTR